MKKMILVLPLLALSACGYSVFDAAEDIKDVVQSGMKDGEKIGTKATSLGNFTKLAIIGPDDVNFEAGDSFTIRAEGNNDDIGELRYKLENGKLVIGRENSNWSSMTGNKITIFVTAPTLTALSMSGSGNFRTAGLEADEFKIALAGSGDANIKSLKTEKISGAVAGSGDLRLAGESTEAKYSLAGSGDIDAKQMKTATAKASIAGSGDINLFASDTVNASIAGSGDIDVTGGAKCKSSVVGSGDVNCAS